MGPQFFTRPDPTNILHDPNRPVYHSQK